MKANYNLKEITTTEELQMRMSGGGAVINFGDRILIAGYTYNRNGNCYYGAIYRFTTADHSIEGEVKLESISEETFADNGHAIAWAMNN